LMKENVHNQEVNWEDFGLVTSVEDGVVSNCGLWAAMAGESIQINNSVEGVSRNVESNVMSLRSDKAEDMKQPEQNCWSRAQAVAMIDKLKFVLYTLPPTNVTNVPAPVSKSISKMVTDGTLTNVGITLAVVGVAFQRLGLALKWSQSADDSDDNVAVNDENEEDEDQPGSSPAKPEKQQKHVEEEAISHRESQPGLPTQFEQKIHKKGPFPMNDEDD